MSEVTRIIQQIQNGNRSATSELLPLVYAELRHIAAQKIRNELPGQTLQPTALVHEAYLRLVGNLHDGWDGRAHFFGAAAEAMRRILIESARRRKSLKRGGERHQFEIDEADAIDSGKDVDELLDLDAALSKLSHVEPELAKLVELRYFVGLTIDEAADALNISPSTVKRQWSYARAWLGRELGGSISAD
ncbi:RNA polymerase subunit sigma [Blastopirellula marina]|uniref:RNA polymerase subunit sigma n=1 Tax=Blastopirellula marina TaxID=124 RepID=A0A2S8F098_9BACT|nr:MULTISPECIES: sigma-70 family RNA polymerase sigma factor [Pirellulaceae]PQO25563.1 RNA polymerase subunit sigma [Blastopirellula marina]RCS42527.1 RNA polymerase subunit sigma [Bremerella cremea]